MATIPKRVVERLRKSTASFQKVLTDARDRDLNESDTVTIITDMLAEVFGFDKYSEITSEQAIRGTFCDLAVKVDGTVEYLIEVKAIGLDLKENHLRQAVNYGANHGIPWVVLTNGICWQIHRIRFERPINHDHVCTLDFLQLNPRRAEDLDFIFLMCKEGLGKKAMDEFHEHTQMVNRYTVAAAIRSEPVISTIRRELRRVSDGVRVSPEEIETLLTDVLKRDVCEGEQAIKATKMLSKGGGRSRRASKGDRSASAPESTARATESSSAATQTARVQNS